MPLRQYKYFYENSANIVIKDKPDWIAKEVTYIHNKDGLNALHDYSVHKKKDVIRIATVGDSFTYGMYIDTSDNWSTLLEKKLNAQECGSSIFEVLNFGVPGYDINYTIQRNKLRVEKYSPNVVLWFIKNDDFTDAKELLIPIEKKMLNGQKYTIDLYNKILETFFVTHDKQSIAAEQKRQLESYINENSETQFIFVLPKGSVDYPAVEDEYVDFILSLKREHDMVSVVQVELNRAHTFFPRDHHFNTKGNEYFSTILTRMFTRRYCL